MWMLNQPDCRRHANWSFWQPTTGNPSTSPDKPSSPWGITQRRQIYLEKAVKLGPSEAAPALHLGLVYLETGERTLAFDYLSTRKKLRPNWVRQASSPHACWSNSFP